MSFTVSCTLYSSDVLQPPWFIISDTFVLPRHVIRLTIHIHKLSSKWMMFVRLTKWLESLFDSNSTQFPHHTMFFYQISFYKLLVTWSYAWLKLKAQSYARHTSVAEGRHSGSTESSLLISCFTSKDIPPQLSSSKSKEPCIPMCTFDAAFS